MVTETEAEWMVWVLVENDDWWPEADGFSTKAEGQQHVAGMLDSSGQFKPIWSGTPIAALVLRVGKTPFDHWKESNGG